ncbi:TIGR03885 family FMN-dependent LLM class oxidoreductase [Desertifilum sp. FACHB-1129]|uniref:LLM class F420-dependent oxidoreductase n=1 Tax=Desertifilum tharense IPPAS B-1220 TaxID=1781255 RepID=A0A1E5QND3_9CYAN|nr:MULTISPECIES: TIGR03885 family FMN-dependent LLM class oxidoreductase [Desertifilum]MDA0210323.1 TIGR03885 family FMN-dependent LLM class oxidoreductase [Cyanobacteria bacterium FC1]MDI9640839.1 TIGR03885 family FMN-dependent LLM class oxidoreductase [Geitlerinema splendidum]MDL5051674.1 TIGR03885 family FMN-dependent LLM class oxidoreductase [Oscillatoria amoena NRMC-F 0135]MBD2310270.1 TIGR03885 family FMN-dependent LLM class oxidoreductase [Desertifilum sp. FACHB-1129]MBD2322646.1 TIGR03
MAQFGYHASHEQFKPSELLKYVQAAHQAGFNAALSSDHFQPWSDRQGESGYAWSWLGAALQATQLSFGVVCAPGQRYHPAIIAQAAATLAEMYPNRFWVALGSGQALNEQITAEGWPAKSKRNQRLLECVDIIRALWAGETVTHHGIVQIEEAKLYTRPTVAPRIIGAAITPKTAEWVGGWADGLITVSHPYDKLKEVVDAFHRGGGRGKPLCLKVQLSYAQDEEQALQGAYDQWRTNIFASPVLSEFRHPQQFDAAAQFVKPEDMHPYVRISAKPEQHIEWLQQYLDLGFSELYLHNVNREQEAFIETFSQKVLPALSH